MNKVDLKHKIDVLSGTTNDSTKFTSSSSKSSFEDSRNAIAQQKKTFMSPPRSSMSPVPPPTQFASASNNAIQNIPKQPQPASIQRSSETDSGKVKGEQYSTFSASSKAAKSSSSGKFFSYSKATKSETISSKSQQTKSSSNSMASSPHGGIQVLPSIQAPVKLEEPPVQVSEERMDRSRQEQRRNRQEFQSRSTSNVGVKSQKSVESIEADQFIEQLMREAETDPKLRELTYGKSGSTSEAGRSMPPSGVPKNYAAPKPPPVPTSDSPQLGESYPMVQRPYRTAQDMIIKERDDSPTHQERLSTRPMERHKMQKRPYRTNEDLKIVDISERSKSADGRLNNNKAFHERDPKLGNFASVASVENVASATGSKLLGEVVTDNEHHSVRDLVRMMERQTHSESVNPYIRKWGCDLISPEPHSKQKTYRREKREMPKPFFWNPPAGIPPNDPRFASQHSQQAQADHNENMADVSYTSGDHTNTTLDNEFNLNDHITDMNSLLGRSQGNNLTRYEDELMNQTGSSCVSKLGGIEDDTYNGPQRTATPVIWPPPSPIPQQNEVDSHYPSNGMPNQSPIPPSPPPPPPALLLTQDLQQKATRSNAHHSQQKYGRSYSSGRAADNNVSSNSFASQPIVNGGRNSLTEIDKQIVTIQNEFEAELDTLIDAYRKLQQTKRKEGVPVEGTDFLTQAY